MREIVYLRLLQSDYVVIYNKQTGEYYSDYTGVTTVLFDAKYYVGGYLVGSAPCNLTSDFLVFNPNPAVDTNPPTIKLQNENVAEGTYICNCTISAVNYDTSQEFQVTMIVIDGNPEPEPPFQPDNVKYILNGENLEGIKWRLEIWEKGFQGLTTEVRGTINHNYDDAKSLVDPIIASSLQVGFEASPYLTLTDLYSENERTFKGLLYFNDNLVFAGYVKPDGIYEDYVNDRWILDIDIIDGLSTLKNLSFVDDNGYSFRGKLNLLSIIQNCLHRTGLDLPLNVSLGIYYDGFDFDHEENTILTNVYASTERFYQDESQIMDCESILKSVLQIFNAKLVQMNGEWFIYRAIDVENEMIFKQYSPNGSYSTDNILIVNEDLGSKVDNYELFHCNANQRKTINASVQAYRIYFKYGNVKSIIQNSTFLMGTGLTANGWTIYNLKNRFKRNDNGSGFFMQITKDEPYDEDGVNGQLLQTNQTINILEGDTLDLTSSFTIDTTGGYVVWSFEISTPNYQYVNNVGWMPKPVTSYRPNPYISVGGEMNEQINYNFKLPPTLEDGVLTLKIFVHAGSWVRRVQTDGEDLLMSHDFKFTIDEVKIAPTSNNIKGLYFTGERSQKISTVTKENVTVYNGDSESDIYVGTLYKSDGTPTEKWNRLGKTDERPLLWLNVYDNLKLSPRPMMIFEGDVYTSRYLPYLSLLSINNISGQYQPISWRYNLNTSVLSLQSLEFNNVDLDYNQYTIDLETDFGNETRVTIN